MRNQDCTIDDKVNLTEIAKTNAHVREWIARELRVEKGLTQADAEAFAKFITGPVNAGDNLTEAQWNRLRFGDDKKECEISPDITP